MRPFRRWPPWMQRVMAWVLVTSTPAIVIAMVASGIDLDHPDLSPNLWTNSGEAKWLGMAWTTTATATRMTCGVGTFSGTSDVWDDNGHGTLAAGIAAASTDNGIGVAGLCLNCPRGARAPWL